MLKKDIIIGTKALEVSMSQPDFTIPSMDPPATFLEMGVTFQVVSSKTPTPVLSFSMSPTSYHRRRLRNLIRFRF